LIGKIHGLPKCILGGILGAILGIIIWIVVDIISIGILYKRSGPRRERCLEEALNHNDPITKDDFKEHATDLYKFLVHELGFWEAISNWRVWRGVNAWNAIFEPVQYTAGLTHYLRDYISIPFLGRGNGGQLRRIAAIAQSSVEVTRPEASRSKTNIDGLVRKVDRIVENYWGNRSDVYYDAACFHARLSKFYELGSNKRTQTLEKALEYLKKATKGQHQLEIQWTRLDPDLEVLHENPEFQELFDVRKESKNWMMKRSKIKPKQACFYEKEPDSN
jgi:hypothetical protein